MPEWPIMRFYQFIIYWLNGDSDFITLDPESDILFRKNYKICGKPKQKRQPCFVINDRPYPVSMIDVFLPFSDADQDLIDWMNGLLDSIEEKE